MIVEDTIYYFECGIHGPSMSYSNKEECRLQIREHYVKYGRCANLILNTDKFVYRDLTLDEEF